tara:strand:+ start:478 stop:1344 length:867 start_codon:yes stop_codon:yes gene_type:complete
MKLIKDTELILTDKKKIYHLNLSPDDIASDIIIVGDPDRVSQVSNFFDTISLKVQHREFITHTGTYNNKRISVLSTGIGTDNIDIVLNELDALINIDFQTRTVKKIKKSLNIIRIGTSGSIQKDVKVDSFVMASHGLGFDGLAHFYKHKGITSREIANLFIKHSNWPQELSQPYVVEASGDLLARFTEIKKGITATATGFYAPQGRELRVSSSINNLHAKLNSFSYKNTQIVNFEMETSALYFLSKLLGHNALTICAVIGNRITKKYSKDYAKTINVLIEKVLKRLTN